MRLLIILAVSLLVSTSYADQKAITDTGDEVVLYSNGTWSYTDDTVTEKKQIPTNPRPFIKPADAQFMLKSTKNNTACWINTSLWSFQKATTEGAAAEYEFQLKGEDLYGMVINEALTMSIDTLAAIALENAKASAPNAKVLKKEYRSVNNIEVLYMEMSGNMGGIEFTYLGYYYSDASGVSQFISYTGSSLVKRYRPQIDNFLNGFTLQ